MAQLRRAAGWILAIAILVFLGQTLLATWDQVVKSGFEFRFDWLLLAISLGLLVVGRSFAVEAWRRIVTALGNPISFRVAFRGWFISNLARYIPGNIWQVATLMVIVEPYGVTKTNVVLSQAVYTTIALSIAGLFGLYVLPLFIPALANWIWIAGALFIVAVLVLAQPRVFEFIVELTAKFMARFRARFGQNGNGNRPIVSAPRAQLTFLRGLLIPLCSACMWTTNGIAFFLFMRSTTGLSLDKLPVFIAMNAAAYLIGYVSFITPSGLGFREGALVAFLSPFFPTPVAVALALAARLWSTAGEMLGVLIAVLPTSNEKSNSLSGIARSETTNLRPR